MELSDDVGADIAGGGQDPKEIPPRRWSERLSEASCILPKHPAAIVSVSCPRSCGTRLLDRLEVESEERRESATDVRPYGDEMAADADDGGAGHSTGTYIETGSKNLCSSSATRGRLRKTGVTQPTRRGLDSP